MKNIELLHLGEKLRKAIATDWKEQRRLGQRRSAWSQLAFDEQLFADMPHIGTKSALKSIYIYNKYNTDNGVEEKILSDERISHILEYLFKYIMVQNGWPNTVKLMKEFMGGKYYGLIRPFLSDVKTDMVSEAVAVYGDGNKLSTQLMQLALKAQKQESDLGDTKQEMEKNLRKFKVLKSQTLQLIEEVKKVAPHRVDEINKMLSDIERMFD